MLPRPRQFYPPRGDRHKTAHTVGGGMAGMAFAAFLATDAHMPLALRRGCDRSSAICLSQLHLHSDRGTWTQIEFAGTQIDLFEDRRF
jgi:hypothetical protein